MNKSTFANKVWQYLFALQIIMVLMPALVKSNAITPEIPEASDNEDDFMLPNDSNLNEMKRNWQSLHGAWGKRAMINDMDQIDTDKVAYMARVPYGIWINPASLSSVDSSENMYDENIYNDKRGWKKMNVAWGKRRNNGYDFAPRASAAGAWGKREPNWNSLKGMWGKRAAPSQWHRLNQGFGKRSVPYPEAN